MEIKDIENQIINADCMDILKELPDKCVDLVLTDPPYGYLKIDFDKNYFLEEQVFTQIARVLKKDGLIVFSGRGDKFFRQNLILEKLGVPFKEEIIWNKKASSTCFNDIQRKHELFVIRGNKKLNYITENWEEHYIDNTQLVQAINRVISTIKKKPELICNYIKNGKIKYDLPRKSRNDITISKKTKTIDRGLAIFKGFFEGFKLPSILNISRDNVYRGIHPTQKPIKLYEVLIKLCSNENDLILDCFSGSGTTAVACHNLKRRFICIEKDSDYWEASVERLKNAQAQMKLF